MSWFTTSDGTRIRFSDRKPLQETQPPIVLVHGWKQSHRLFDRSAYRLIQKGHRVVTYDSRGMGESDKPDGDYSFDTLAQDLHEILEFSGVQGATLLGWSMGCTISIEYLLRHEKHTPINKLVLHNGPLKLTKSDDFEHALTAEQLEAYNVASELEWPQSEKLFQRESLLPNSDESRVDWLWKIALETPLDIALKLVRNQAQIDHRPAIKHLSLPILALYSEQEPFWPISLAEWIAKNAKNGQLITLKNSSHSSPLEEPQAFSDAVSTFTQNA